MSSQIHLLNDDCLTYLQRGHLRRGSIDAVITDLPYVRRTRTLFYSIPKVCEPIMRPGAPWLTYTGHHALPTLLSMMEKSLQYLWLGKMLHSTVSYRREVGVYTLGKPYAIFYKGPVFQPVEPIRDVIMGSGRSKRYHPWEQPVAESRKFIRWLTRPGEWILDPCCGSGTTLLAAWLEGRNAIGIEIDRRSYEVARRRLEVEGIRVLSGKQTDARSAPALSRLRSAR